MLSLQFLLTATHWNIDYVVNIKIDSSLYDKERELILFSSKNPILIIYAYLFIFCLFKVLA